MDFGLALAEALGFQDDQQPTRTHSHLRRGLLLSDDGEESVMHEDQDLGSTDPANIASSKREHSPHETHDSNYKDLGKKETRYSQMVDKDKKSISAQQKQ